ncbi:MAG: DNA-binding protein [Gammaproteobacteria bacterium CG11_big_fil_rev_8_21_14_0_20_46_22]|nr:MAG: DNA-binding protein [Gammaproteobacteria bacterium CG11_big_fil_rev_8_21_14_0_20_46_22]
MNKKEFIENLEKAGGFKQEVAEGVYKVFVETLMVSLLNGGDKTLLPEMGKFEVKTRKARSGINPNTGEKLQIPEKKILTFKASKQFLAELNKD